MSAITVKEWWADFEARVIPPNASETQRKEMRKAFYGGAFACLIISNNIADRHNNDVNAGARALKAVEDECVAFAMRGGNEPN